MIPCREAGSGPGAAGDSGDAAGDVVGGEERAGCQRGRGNGQRRGEAPPYERMPTHGVQHSPLPGVDGLIVPVRAVGCFRVPGKHASVSRHTRVG